jgi:hypothetical protein
MQVFIPVIHLQDLISTLFILQGDSTDFPEAPAAD